LEVVTASETSTTWTIGSIQLLRVPYFDIALSPESIDLEGVADSVDWAEPWLTDQQPTVGQAFWIIRSDSQTIVVDPCGASDGFLRSGPTAVDHQTAAFDLLRATGVEPESVDQLVLTHLDGIGMAALADGAPEGEETWTPAFPHADVIVSESEYDYIASRPVDLMGADGFAALDDAGVVRPVAVPHEIAPGVTLRPTGKHSPGHCCVHIESGTRRAVMIGHLAISPLHAARGVSANHHDSEGAWNELRTVLDDAAHDGALVAGSLWPAPGAARVTATEPFELVPADRADS
jgi:glyoxylase-like metal-dependent hydrolase (beta-lactamase superfamily II)